MDPPDEELAARSREGDRGAFLHLVDRYGGPVRSYLRARSVSPSDLDDLAQDVFVRAYQSIDSLADPASFAGWLFAIARNRALDWSRSRGRRPPAVALDRVFPEPADPRADPVRAVAAVERLATLRRAIADLPEVFRTTLYLKHQMGYSCEEIARLHGVGVGTVTKRLSRAYERIRLVLGPEGV